MPKNVRNFWLTALADGPGGNVKLTKIGSVGSTGGMHFSLQVRDKGEVLSKELYVGCRSDGEKNAIIVLFDGKLILSEEFER